MSSTTRCSGGTCPCNKYMLEHGKFAVMQNHTILHSYPIYMHDDGKNPRRLPKLHKSLESYTYQQIAHACSETYKSNYELCDFHITRVF